MSSVPTSVCRGEVSTSAWCFRVWVSATWCSRELLCTQSVPIRVEGAFFPIYSNQTDYWTAKSYDPESPDYMVAANPDAKLFRIYGQLDNVGSTTRTSDMYLQNGAYMRIKN